MAIDWNKFNKKVDLDAVKEAADTASENSDYPEIPDGSYEVGVEKMELTTSKAGDPMVTIWFVIEDGDFKGQRLFHNGVIQPQNDRAVGFQIHRNNELLRALSDDDEVKFEDFAQYADLILDIAEEIIEDKWAYEVKKSTNNKGYTSLEVVQILD